MSSHSKSPIQAIQDLVTQVVRESSFNRLNFLDGSPVADEPLVGFADAYDPVIQQFKTAVGPQHLTPLEAWSIAYRGRKQPEHLSVIGFVLPFSEAVRVSNHVGRAPSAQWFHAKAHADAIIKQVKACLVSSLNEQGHHAVAPSATPAFRVEYDAPMGPASNWSERHYCYAAGLGTFGLSKGLITRRGVAMRCGTVVVDMALPTSPRPASHTAYCKFLEGNGCGECMERCPAGVITPQGKDNMKCRAYLNEGLDHLTKRYMTSEVVQHTGATALGACGLCQTGVPCEDRIP